jgi:hypothetical protein
LAIAGKRGAVDRIEVHSGKGRMTGKNNVGIAESPRYTGAQRL